MVQKLLFLSVIIMGCLSASAQVGYNHINVNSIKTGMHANGSMFMNEDFSSGNFLVPYEEGMPETTTIFASSLWMGGVERTGRLKAGFMTYPRPQMQYVPGPLHDAPINSNIDFNKVWKVTKAEIDAHREDFADGTIDNPIPSALLEWPARGNKHYDPALPDNLQLAPFYDHNDDNIYNPADGDYPVIGNDMNRVIPDELLYSVCNTNHPRYTYPADIEIHTLMYAFDCNESTELNNTVFTRHYIVAQTKEEYLDFRIGVFQDTDLGCHEDDYVGCDTTQNLFFTYNKNSIDGNEDGNCQFGGASYGSNPPVQSTMILNHEMNSYLAYFNTSIGTPDFQATDPSNENEVYKMLGGTFKEGSQISTGGNGYNPDSTNYTKFSFHGDPNDPDAWSMNTAGFGTSLDTRALASIHKGNLVPGEVMKIDMAHIYTSDPSLNHLETITAAKNDAKIIRDLYSNRFSQSCTTSSIEAPIVYNVEVYPNPSMGRFVIAQKGEFTEYVLLNNLGQTVSKGTLSETKTSISLDLASGMYHLKLMHNSNGKQHVEAVVIE